MNTQEKIDFNAGVALAQAGKKEEAYAKLRPLANNSQDNANLFLWIAFTTPNMIEAEKAIRRAQELDPNDQNVHLARTWLLGQKAKTLPAAGTTSKVEVIDNTPPPPPPNNNYQTQNYQNGFSSQPMPNPVGLGTYNYGPPPTQPPVMVFPQTVYMPYQPVQTTINQNHNLLFFIPLIGTIGAAVALFLSWITIGFTTGYSSYDISFNGFGSASGSSALVGALSQYNMTRLTDKMHGTPIICLVSVALVLLGVGFYRRTMIYPLFAFIVGLIVLGLFIWDYSSLNDMVTSFNLNYSQTYSNTPSGAQLGPGMIIGIIGGAVMMLGNVILLIVFQNEFKKDNYKPC